ncbi:leucine-rich repeat-containing protein kinase family protein [Pedobacter sp. GR22-6]|uniref:leucine-rich repeat-containing protein kinase family protein n=1 Tax=Pedobacter sp. GR22-6 TaxID=3127957 RepID=UPI00307D26A9
MQSLDQLLRGELKGSVSLKLSEGLSSFPEQIFELSDSLEILDLSKNQLTELPADFGRLKKLRIFFCSENQFRVLPEVLGDCPLLDIVGFKSNCIEVLPTKSLNTNLRWLILTDNKIEELPAEIGHCKRMQKLMLAGNRLSFLPKELERCNHLSLLRISANQLIELPEWLLTMPKLSWLAFSGNPFCIRPDLPLLPFVRWSDLHIEQLLGEGASGLIFKATRKVGTENQEVAVKVFKGDVTSDGFPEDEMIAYIAAGVNSGLPSLIGDIDGHPEGKKGLVMELIPPRFFNLGLPPSLESCTRDVFKEGQDLSLSQIFKIAETIASLAAQLHKKGIMHGDLYAHNTLIDQEGNTLFGDFGAASFYGAETLKSAAALEALEVSAYGQLLDDLISLCHDTASQPLLAQLSSLRDSCLHPDIKARPGFEKLSEMVSALRLSHSSATRPSAAS